jgi:predicted RNase H-like HicB family nuclease
MKLDFDIVLEKQKVGYTAYVPALPGCISEGNNKEQAMKNIKEAIGLYLEEKGNIKVKQLSHLITIERATIDAHA